MTVGLSNCWTSDFSFEISDLLIYVMTYIGRFRISVAGCAGCSQAPPRRRGCRLPGTLYNTSHDVRVGVHGAIFRPIAL